MNILIPKQMETTPEGKAAIASLEKAKGAAMKALSISEDAGGTALASEKGKEFEALCAEAEAGQEYAKQLVTLWEAKQPVQTVDFAVKQPEHKEKTARIESLSTQLLGKRGDFSMAFADGAVEATYHLGKAGIMVHQNVVNLLEDVYDPEVFMLPRRELVIADLFSRGQTAGTTIYYRKQATRTNSAAWVSEGETKPESAMTFERASTTVKKLAHWESVTTEALQDYPQMRSLIEDDLLFGLAYKLDESLLWGDGSSDSITGVLNTALIQTVTATAAYLDDIRKAITKVQVIGQGYQARGVAMTAQMWESIELMKTSEGEFMYVIFYAAGVPMVWRLPVVVSQALINPAAPTEHHTLVGDFRRGAKIWDKETANVSVGLVNDQFIKNEQTLLAELRLAFAVKVPSTFVDIQYTVA